MDCWGSDGRWEVVGIDPAATEVLAALEDPAVGVLVLTGPAGIGKTALARQVAARSEAADRPCLRVVASTATAALPFGALGALVSAGDDAAPTAVATDGLAGNAPGVAAAVRAMAGKGRLLLVVDDLPLLDQASAAEVAHLVLGGTVVVLGTARAGTTLPGPIGGLQVEGRLRTRTVAPITPGLVAEAAEAALGAPLDDDALAEVVTRSAGVPLHARELVHANLEAGRLALVDGRWRFRGSPLAPTSLFDLVASRFLHLDDAQQRSVEALCLSQPLPVAAAVSLVGSDVLVELERNDLVAVDDEAGASVVRLAHPLYEESVRASLRPLRRRAAAERAVEALGSIAVDDADMALRLACLRLDNELPPAAPETLVAARRALRLLDPALAERLLRASGAEGFEARLLLGAALAAQGRTGEADEVLAIAGEVATSDEERARVLSRRAGTLGPGAGRFEEAAALLSTGLGEIEDPRWRGFLEADLAYVRSWLGVRSTPTGGAGATVPREVRANECLVGAVIAAMAGELAEAEALATEGFGVVSAIEHDVPHARDMLTLSRFLARAFGGRASSAAAIADAELARARASSSGATGVWLAVRSLRNLVDGQLPMALGDADEAVEMLILGDVAGLRPLSLAVRSVAWARLGDVAASQTAAAGIEPSWRDEVKVQILLTQAAAWQEAVAGRRSEAVDLLTEAGRIGLEANHVPLGGLATYDAVRLGQAASVTGLLAECAARWEGPLARAIADHAALAAGTSTSSNSNSSASARQSDLARLVSVAESLPSLGHRLGAVSAWRDVATSATHLGDDASARRAALEMARCNLYDVADPAEGRPRLLTDRELQVVELAADGLTSKEVAARLGCSVRTVDNHLASAYRKLGVSRRRELADLLREITPPM